MFTLALDCSTARGSVALMEEPAGAPLPAPPLFQTEFPAGRGQGGGLFTALTAALRVLPAGESLGGIVVGLGPGSYSGVRQAIAAAVGLSVSTGAALAGVPSPAGLETDFAAFQAVGDARRGTFYHTAVADGQPLPPGPVLLPDQAALDAQLARHAGWPVLAVETAADLMPPGSILALPLAARLLRVPPAARVPPPLEPIYLRAVAITLPKGA